MEEVAVPIQLTSLEVRRGKWTTQEEEYADKIISGSLFILTLIELLANG